MKQGCLMFCLSVVLTFLGCNDDDFVVHSGLVSETQTVHPTSTGNSRTFDYDEKEMLISVITDLGYRGSQSTHFLYNPEGDLIRYESSNSEFGSYVDLKYKENLVTKSITVSSSFALGFPKKISTYEYNTDNQRIYQIDTVIKNMAPPDTTIFHWQFLYNSQGSIINKKQFDDEGKLLREHKLEYDNKINPFFGKNSGFYGELNLFTTQNNISRSTEIFNNTTSVFEYFYTYDNQGFPIEIRKEMREDYLQITYK